MRRLFLFMMTAVMVVTRASAQGPISGRVHNAATGEILPYVTVAVKGKSIGVISDREGMFKIRSGESLSPADSIVFSHVGFITEARTVGQLTGGGGLAEVSLRQGEYEIERIIVTNRKSRLAKLGHSSGGTGVVQAGWRSNTGGEEFTYDGVNHEGGVPIKIKGDTDILSFGMHIRQNGYDRALLRLSFYSLKDNTPGELIVHKDIKFEVKDRLKGRFEVDLSPYGISFAGGQEILVTLTLLEDEMTGDKPEAFMLDGALFGRGLYDREIGEESWRRFGFATIAMYLNARVYR